MRNRRLLLTGLVASALSVLAGTAGAATVPFAHTGAPQSWTVPEGVKSATFDLFGSAGLGPFGGSGARVRSTIPVVPGERLLIYVGGNRTPIPVRGGFNGGGDGSSGSMGGGATDVRRGPALADRILIAGGGGGSGGEFTTSGFAENSSPDGSSAGGAAGQDGKTGPNQGSGGGGGGATSSSGGSGGAAGPGTGPIPPEQGCCFEPGSAGAPGTLGQGGAGGAEQKQAGAGAGGGGGGLYGGGGGGAGGSIRASNPPGEGGGGGGGSSLASKPEDVTIERSSAQGGQGFASVTFVEVSDLRTFIFIANQTATKGSAIVSVKNPGPGLATGVVLDVRLPDGARNTRVQSGTNFPCVASSSTSYRCTTDEFPKGDEDPSFFWTRSGSATQTISAAVRHGGGDPSPLNNTARYTFGKSSAPVLGSLGLTPSSFKAAASGPAFVAKVGGTRVSFVVSAASRAEFTVQRKSKGRLAARRCRTQTATNRNKPACVRWINVKGSFIVAAKKGTNDFTFRGRIGGKALKPGNYRLNGQATDKTNNKSAVKRKSFRIVK